MSIAHARAPMRPLLPSLFFAAVLGVVSGCAPAEHAVARDAAGADRTARVARSVNLQIEASGDTAEHAVEAVHRRAGELVDRLMHMGFSPTDVLATSFVLDGAYRATLELEIVARDARQAADLKVAAAALGFKALPRRANSLATNAQLSPSTVPSALPQ
jgi:hypothetical protein